MAEEAGRMTEPDREVKLGVGSMTVVRGLFRRCRLILADNCTLEWMGFETFGLGGGREDI